MGLLAWLLPALAGCAAPPTRVPMDVTRIAGPCRTSTLVVLMPGIRDRPQSFVEQGFVDALAERRIAADVWLADSHVGYFEERSILARLREDVVRPARAAGYAKVWLAGISLGGYGAFGYAARERTLAVDGIVAIAPYPGRPSLLQQIEQAGGPSAWGALPHTPEGPDDADLDIWQWLAQAPAGAPPVWLAYGRDDRFAAGHRLIAQALPAERVLAVDGGHRWGPWRQLWSAWLDGAPIERCAA